MERSIRSLQQERLVCAYSRENATTDLQSIYSTDLHAVQVLTYLLCNLGVLSYILSNSVVHKTPSYYSPALVPNLTVCNLLESKKSCINSVSQLSSTPRPASYKGVITRSA